MLRFPIPIFVRDYIFTSVFPMLKNVLNALKQMANKTGGVKIDIVLHIVSMSTASRIDTTGDLMKVNSDN